MKKLGLLDNVKTKKSSFLLRKDFINFVESQFNLLKKKHLKVPIQLYQL